VPDSREEERPAVGLGDALSGLAATAVSTLRTRLELATVEFEEQRERTKIMLIMVAVATVFSCFALIALSALVVALLWDSHPIGALVGVAVTYAVIAAIALYALKQSSFPRPFEATLHELERDADALKRRP
jgi:uncharacterized membrane protein YqjE